MIEGMIKSAFDAIQQRAADALEFLLNPLWKWWAIFALVAAACTLIGFFLPFKWIRAGLGGIIILAGAFVAGGTVMYREEQARLKAERAKLKQKERELQSRQTRQSSQGSWWR